MSNTAQVIVEDTGVVGYVHYEGHTIYERVAEGLHRAAETATTCRLDDPSYLTRIVLDAANPCPGATRGFGVCAEPFDRVYRTVVVNGDNRTVTIETIYEDDDNEGVYGVEEFIEEYAPEDVETER